jgi:hypothetical protein
VRRWAAKAALMLILGFVLGAVIVPFMLARWGPERGSATAVTPVPTDGITLSTMKPGYAPYALRQEGFGFAYTVVMAIRTRKMQTSLDYGKGVRCEAGWPLSCWEIVTDAVPAGGKPRAYQDDFWKSPSVFAAPKGSITRFNVRWSGVLAATALFGGTPLVMMAVPSVVRYLRQKRRPPFACPSCGYDRGGIAKDAACPECGKPQ